MQEGREASARSASEVVAHEPLSRAYPVPRALVQTPMQKYYMGSGQIHRIHPPRRTAVDVQRVYELGRDVCVVVNEGRQNAYRDALGLLRVWSDLKSPVTKSPRSGGQHCTQPAPIGHALGRGSFISSQASGS